ncbi:MAG: molybdopterin molybdenumtransferase MoeA [Dehalococcoidia bacterium]|nr:molybdopterin molybdenumtransferase MoeA [Dehalococcoidia bacterium]
MPTAHAHSHNRHDHKGMPKIPGWLTVEQALERILSCVSPLPAEQRPLLESLGQVLAADIRAPLDVPPHANSSMDGYAVQWESVRHASARRPARLRVTGTLAAGQAPSGAVAPGTAIRIMTGAPIPPGADTVVPFEYTDELARAQRGEPVAREVAVVAAPPSRGANIREAGEDIARGTTVLHAGTVLRPAEIGVLASLGMIAAPVIRRPVVAILSTGDELAEAPAPLAPGQIYNSNSFTIAASVLRYGGIPRVLGVARDTLDSLRAKIAEGLSADMLITTAGVSRGDYDIVKDVLMQQGEISFWTVRMKPAKPLAFGALQTQGPDGKTRRVPHLGLPGNPVSSLVAFEQFGRPAILKMLGKRSFAKPVIRAVLEDDIVNTDERRVYARVSVTLRDGVACARLTGPQGSGVLTSMAKADGLAICPEDTPVLRAGETADIQMLDWPEDRFADPLRPTRGGAS